MDSFPRVFSHKSWICWGVKYGLCSLTVEAGIPIRSPISCAEVRRVRSGKVVVAVTVQVQVTDPRREEVGTRMIVTSLK